MTEFDTIILGTEPAGVWLANRLSAKSRVGMITFGKAPPLSVPLRVAELFQDGESLPWSIEILNPQEVISWDRDSLVKQFSVLSEWDPLVGSLMEPGRGVLNSIDKILKVEPDLWVLASSLWKYIGRADRIQPASLLWAALGSDKMSFWHGKALPAVEELPLALEEGGIEQFEYSKRSGVRLRLNSGVEWVAEKLVLNCSLSMLSFLFGRKHAGDFVLSHLSPEAVASFLVPLKIKTLSRAIPLPAPPLVILCEEKTVPDPNSEVWPLEFRRETETVDLTLWVSVPRPWSLEVFLERATVGMGVLNRNFPFLSESLLSIDPSLGLNDCSDEALRLSVWGSLQAQVRENYSLSHFRTDFDPIYCLSPSLNCYLSYPLGALKGAMSLFEQWEKKTRKSDAHPAP